MDVLVDAAIERLRSLPEKRQHELAEIILKENGEPYVPTAAEQAAIDEGLAQIARGEVHDWEDVRAEMYARLKK